MICTVIMFSQEPDAMVDEHLRAAKEVGDLLVAHMHCSSGPALTSAAEWADVVLVDEDEEWHKGRQLTRIMRALDSVEPEWVVLLDGDDLCDDEFSSVVRRCTAVGKEDAYAFRYDQLWDSRDHVLWGAGGGGGDRRRVLWRWRPGLTFPQDPAHSSMCPVEMRADPFHPSGGRLLHAGYQRLDVRLLRQKRAVRIAAETGYSYASAGIKRVQKPIARDRKEDLGFDLAEALSWWATNEQHMKRRCVTGALLVPSALDFVAWNLGELYGRRFVDASPVKAGPAMDWAGRFRRLGWEHDDDAQVALLVRSNSMWVSDEEAAREVARESQAQLLLTDVSPLHLSKRWQLLGGGGVRLYVSAGALVREMARTIKQRGARA